MNRLRLTSTSMILFFSLVPMVSAQQRQLLKYSFSSDAEQPRIRSISRILNLSENLPRNIKLPSIGQTRVLCTKWMSTAVPGHSFTILLVRSARSKTYDMLLIDSNGNGDLTDESPYRPSRISKSRSRTRSDTLIFNPVEVRLDSAEGLMPYHLRFELYSYDKRRYYLRMSSAGWRSGEVIVNGKRYTCTLIDYNVNGTFSDRPLRSISSDRIILTAARGGSSIHYVGKLIEIDGRFYELDVALSGASLAIFPPSESVRRGFIAVPAEVTKFSVLGENGYFNLVPENGRASVPEGHYRLYHWTIERKSGGHNWALQGSRFGNEAAFHVTPDTVVKLPIGEPIYAKLQINEIAPPNRSRSRSSRTSTNRPGNNGLKQFSIKQELQGNLAQSITITRDGRRMDAPSLRISSTRTTYSETFQLRYG